MRFEINCWNESRSNSQYAIEPYNLWKDDGFKRQADLIRVFVDQRVGHVQINVVHSDTLRAAQREPEKYKDLTVKVAGYNASRYHYNLDIA